jgi:hypothetical protein
MPSRFRVFRSDTDQESSEINSAEGILLLEGQKKTGERLTSRSQELLNGQDFPPLKKYVRFEVRLSIVDEARSEFLLAVDSEFRSL